MSERPKRVYRKTKKTKEINREEIRSKIEALQADPEKVRIAVKVDSEVKALMAQMLQKNVPVDDIARIFSASGIEVTTLAELLSGYTYILLLDLQEKQWEKVLATWREMLDRKRD